MAKTEKSLLLLFKKKHKLLATVVLIIVMGGCAGAPEISKRKSNPRTGLEILERARSQIGKKYCFGGRSPREGFDCSGLAWWSHQQSGINIPRESQDQYRAGKKIRRKDLKPGDLVYFTTYRIGASHVGIYDGRGGFIHSPNSKKTVERQSLSNSYYKQRYLGARRFW